MNSSIDNPLVPRKILISAGILIVFAITCAALGHLSGAARPATDGVPVLSRSLRFVDQPDGALAVVDAQSKALIRLVPPGTESFMRLSLQGLAGLRERMGGAADAVLRLTKWRDGRLTLDDPGSGTRLELEAFGPTNEGAFAQLLNRENAGPPPR